MLVIHRCPLHEAAPEMLAALKSMESILDGRQPIDVPGAVMVAHVAIAKAERIPEKEYPFRRSGQGD